MKRVYKVEGLAEKPEKSTMIQDGISKIANISSVDIVAEEGLITVEIASDHGVMTQLIQHVVHQNDADFNLELLEEIS